MEAPIKSSFIPTEPVREIKQPRVARGGGLTDLFVLASIVIFVGSVGLGIGMFLYLQYLTANTASKVEQLERAQQAFEPALIQELTRLHDRMQAANIVLGNHIAPSVFFRALEQLTLQTVSYSSLNFQANEIQNMTLEMDGLARSVNAIALQADLLSKSGIVSSPIFTNITRTAEGVQFDLSAVVNPASLRFIQVVRAGQFAAPASASQRAPASSSQTTPASASQPASAPQQDSRPAAPDPFLPPSQ
ncbi:hypothetical protein COU20_00325 [Candidatus Kaiserbacteria bacterium CG10_big_fil_rev_8_21_14_0_10_59_10]|uniref:PilN domain-containing protein n=1 Tax=Candidatus Kaiserbacteria bacterium CG10_big_fil_rev_8_21_14_0_10_59_10 TaxID=1974612 RepID=A0A2H0U8N3_9BACT|nr:MAG: hypothetical protein COU20_00325 [Candidatus Kaiserbacteria bacterium CG10_big_fil_rev_8_21_14_0_10_59_10]